MPKARPVLSTIFDLSATSHLSARSKSPASIDEEPHPYKKTSLSGGRTMWRARLMLSTLEPETNTAALLRSSIRRGDKDTADDILEQLISTGTTRPGLVKPPGSGAPKATTVLPPDPRGRGRIA